MSRKIHDSVRFVLVEPSHPGNIGAVARAIKTMGFSRLVLVNPKRFPDLEATARAAGADDVLENCQVVTSLEAAISDCAYVLGTSVRDRQISWPIATPKQTAEKLSKQILEHEKKQPLEVAILFGRERTGLENHELDHAQWQIRIPANDKYNSLNLASAAQIIAYEMHCAFAKDSEGIPDTQVKACLDAAELTGVQERQRLATHTEMQGFYAHLEQTLLQLDFIKTNPPTKLLRKIIRLYNRSHVSFEELQILRGMLTATQNKLKKT